MGLLVRVFLTGFLKYVLYLLTGRVLPTGNNQAFGLTFWEGVVSFEYDKLTRLYA